MLNKAILCAALAVSCSSCSAVNKFLGNNAIDISVSKDVIPPGSDINAEVKITPPQLPPKTVRVSAQS